MNKTLLEKIETETEERKLLALAYRVEGDVQSGQMSPEYYAECMMVLSKKLGFPITTENLDRAAAKYKGVPT